MAEPATAPAPPRAPARPPEDPFMTDKEIQALIRRTTAQAAKKKKKPRNSYDPTLDATRGPEREDDLENQEFFKEMKRREF